MPGQVCWEQQITVTAQSGGYVYNATTQGCGYIILLSIPQETVMTAIFVMTQILCGLLVASQPAT